MSTHHLLSSPHPSDAINPRHPTLYTSGRGGAGNIFFQHTPSSPTTRPTSNRSNNSTIAASSTPTSTSSRTQRYSLSTGRGGAGNIPSSTEYAIFSFDEELEQQLKLERDVAPIFHLGRGGAGNAVGPDSYPYRRKSGFGSSGSSSSTTSNSSGDGKVKEWPTATTATTTTTTAMRRSADSWRGTLKRLSS